MLDAQAGVQYRGEAPPVPTAADTIAMRVWNFLATGMGGVEWCSLPLALDYYGISDVDGLIHRLLVIKHHKRPDAGDAPTQTEH